MTVIDNHIIGKKKGRRKNRSVLWFARCRRKRLCKYRGSTFRVKCDSHRGFFLPGSRSFSSKKGCRNATAASASFALTPFQLAKSAISLEETLVRASLLKTFIGVRPFWRIEADRSFRLFRLGNTFIECDRLLLASIFASISWNTDSARQVLIVEEEKSEKNFVKFMSIKIKIKLKDTTLCLYLLYTIYTLSITIVSVHLLTSLFYLLFYLFIIFLFILFFKTMTMINCNVIHKG